MTGLSFLNPWMLLAAVAVSIPVFIHLWNRHRAIRLRFAAFEFLLRSQKRMARRLQLKQWLLLLIRCLFLLVCAIVFSKPFLKRAKGQDLSQPRALVLILDDSLSMQYTSPGSRVSLFDNARKKALSLLSYLRGEDRVALLGAGATHELEQITLSFDKENLKKKLGKWKVSYLASNLHHAIYRAVQIVKESRGVRPEIHIFSDMTKHAFEDVRIQGQLPPVHLHSVRPSQKIRNLAVLSVKVKADPIVSQFAYRFTVRVQNLSKHHAREVPVSLSLLGRQRTRGFLSIPPWKIRSKQFLLRLPKHGNYHGKASLPKDGLMPDNYFFFSFKARKKGAVLLVNGDPRSIPYLDELFYADKAVRGFRSPLIIKTCSANGFCPPPSEFQTIVLANVERRPVRWLRQLDSFVRKGGGLLLSMGNRVSPSYYNTNLRAFLPRRLRHVSLAAQNPDGTGVAMQRFFGAITQGHPIFKELYRSGFQFQTARVFQVMLTETRQKGEEGKTLWKFSHGPPALLEKSLGKGKSILLTTTLDRDWSDLPIRPFFLPWFQQTISYLSGGRRFQRAPSHWMGAQVYLSLSSLEPIHFKGPRGSQGMIVATTRGFKMKEAQFPGVYQFYKNGVRLKRLPLIFNVNRSESSFQKMSSSTFKKLGALKKSSGRLLNRESERLWPMFLLALFMLVMLENIILKLL